MRVVRSSTMVFATAAAATGAGQRTDFIQSSSMAVLLGRLVEISAELAAAVGAAWGLVFANLAGGGSGTEFVLELRWGDANAAGVGPGQAVPAGAVRAFGAAGAQAAASQSNFDASLTAFQAAEAGALGVIVSQSLLAGASQGARVSDLVLAIEVTPQ